MGLEKEFQKYRQVYMYAVVLQKAIQYFKDVAQTPEEKDSAIVDAIIYTDRVVKDPELLQTLYDKACEGKDESRL